MVITHSLCSGSRSPRPVVSLTLRRERAVGPDAPSSNLRNISAVHTELHGGIYQHTYTQTRLQYDFVRLFNTICCNTHSCELGKAVVVPPPLTRKLVTRAPGTRVTTTLHTGHRGTAELCDDLTVRSKGGWVGREQAGAVTSDGGQRRPPIRD